MDDKKSDPRWHFRLAVLVALAIPAVVLLSVAIVLLGLWLGLWHISDR